MEIEIIEVDAADRVVFRALCTTAITAWRSEAPARLGPCFAEIELGAIDWSDVRVVSTGEESGRLLRPRSAGVAHHALPFALRATVEDHDQHGVAQLRVQGEVLLVDTTGEAPDGIVGSTIEFAPVDIELYPYEL